MANTFDWIEIRTGDIEASAAFYQALFGWRVLERDTADGLAVWLFDTGGEPRPENLRRGGLWQSVGGAAGIVVYVNVDDIDAALSRVVELGGQVAGPKTAQGRHYRAYFTDPDGNLFGLWQD